MRFVTLTSVADSYQAFFVKEELAREGIECMVVNENLATLLHGGFFADCIIRVLDTDYAYAKQVLDKMRIETATVVCPNCESIHVEYGTGPKNRIKRVLLILLTFVVGLTSNRFQLTYRCNDCGDEFRKDFL